MQAQSGGMVQAQNPDLRQTNYLRGVALLPDRKDSLDMHILKKYGGIMDGRT